MLFYLLCILAAGMLAGIIALALGHLPDWAKGLMVIALAAAVIAGAVLGYFLGDPPEDHPAGQPSWVEQPY